MTTTPDLKGLRYRRMASGLSQKQVADYMTISQSHYSKIERGAVQPKLAQLMRLAKLFDVSLDDLL